MNEATAKRWIESMACSEEQKATALQDIKGKTEIANVQQEDAAVNAAEQAKAKPNEPPKEQKVQAAETQAQELQEQLESLQVPMQPHGYACPA